MCFEQDGGCTCPGDVAKAFGAGADFVMAGGMFAGHTESGGEMMEQNGKKFKIFYGMSSATAMKKHAGGVAEYRYNCSFTLIFLYSLTGSCCCNHALISTRTTYYRVI